MRALAVNHQEREEMCQNEFEEYSLSDEDKEIVEKLSLDDIQKIDEWLRLCISYKWQKVAKVVSMAIKISDEAGELLNVPDVFFGMRIEQLESNGEIVAKGNLKLMRYSEIKHTV